jgi:hypothetical protein
MKFQTSQEQYYEQQNIGPSQEYEQQNDNLEYEGEIDGEGSWRHRGMGERATTPWMKTFCFPSHGSKWEWMLPWARIKRKTHIGQI